MDTWGGSAWGNGAGGWGAGSGWGNGLAGYGAGNNGYYNPYSSYGVSPALGGFADTQIGNMFLQQNEPFAYTRYLEGAGMGGEDALSRFARQQFQRTQEGYGAALATNPTMTYQGYLGGLGNQFMQNQFANIAPQYRGETPGWYASPARWIGR